MLLRRLSWPPVTSFRSRHRSRSSDASDPWDQFWGLPNEHDNPFERVSHPAAGERLLVGIQATSFGTLTADEEFVLDELQREPDAWGLRPFATGPAEPPLGDLPSVVIDDRSERGVSQLRLRWNATDEYGSALFDVDGIRTWASGVAPASSTRHIVEAVAAEQIGAHVVITADPHLLALNRGGRLAELNVLTPLELGPVMGIWARASGAGGSFAHYHPVLSLYHWCLARALTPAAWPGFGAFVLGERIFPNGRLLSELAGSVLDRLDYLLETLDEMAVIWQRDVNNPTLDRLTGLMDNVLLRTWAVRDNLALLIGHWYQIDLPERTAWTLGDSRWRRAVRAKGGRRLLETVLPLSGPINATEELRHHTIHRESLKAMRYQTDAGVEARVRLRRPLSSQIRTRLTAAAQSPSDWGLGDDYPPHEVEHIVDQGGGLEDRFIEGDPGGLFLDLVPFAVHLVAAVARLANGVLAEIDPASDPRLPEALRVLARTMPPDRMFSPELGWQFALTSPVAGLVPWARAVSK